MVLDKKLEQRQERLKERQRLREEERKSREKDREERRKKEEERRKKREKLRENLRHRPRLATRKFNQREFSREYNDVSQFLSDTEQRQLNEVEALAQEEGIELHEKKESTLDKVFDVLRTGEFAVGGLLAGKGIKTGIREEISPSQALGITDEEDEGGIKELATPKGLLGLGVDIMFDPTTYLTFGFGSGTKIATRGAEEVGSAILSRKGMKTFRNLAKEVGEEEAKKTVASRITQDGATDLVDEGGLKFMGKQVLSRGKTLAPFRKVDDIAENMPFKIGETYKSTKDLFNKAFKPFHDVKKLKGAKVATDKGEDIVIGEGTEYVTLFGRAVKGGRAETDHVIRPYKEKGKAFTKKYGKDASEVITHMAETGKNFAQLDDEMLGKYQKLKGDKVAMNTFDSIANFMNKRAKEIAGQEKKRGLLKTEMTNYMRHFLTKEGQKFVNKGGDLMNMLPKPLRVKLGAANPRKIQGTIKEINEKMKDKVGGDMFETNAFKIMAAREVESVKAIRMFDFYQDVADKFGLPMKSFEQEIAGKTAKLSKPFAVVDGVRFVEPSAPMLKGVMVPEPIAKHVDRTAEFLANDEATRSFLTIYDDVLKFWKGSVTGYFPAFHTRNFAGGVFNNWLGGVYNPNHYRKADAIARGKQGFVKTKSGAKISYEYIRREAKRLGVVGQPGYLDVMREVEDKIASVGGKKVKDWFLDRPRYWMETVEDRVRLPMFIDSLVKGQSVDEAAAKVFKFHFDYAPEGLTAFERNVLKRIIPFYRWTRGNIPLQLEQIVKQPGKYAGFAKVIDHLSGGDLEEEKEILPEYMTENYPIKLSNDGGKDDAAIWISSMGLPVEDVNRLWGGSMKRTVERFVGEFIAPLLKVPFEVATGVNTFFGEEIDEMNYVYPYLDDVPGLRTWLDIRERKTRDGKTTYFTTQPERLYALNVAAGRFYSTLGRTSNAPTWKQTLSRLFSPANIKDIDPQQEAIRRERERLRRLEEELKKKGRRSEFNVWYTPDDKIESNR